MMQASSPMTQAERTMRLAVILMLEKAPPTMQFSLTEKELRLLTPPDDAALDPDAALLAELGFSKEVGRDNRMPVSRAKKFVLNGVKKFIAKHEGELKTVRAEAEPYKVKAAQLDNADRMILTNPEGFMTFLAGVNPAYKDYVKGGAAPAATAADPLAALGPKPGPDLKYADGTEGYTPKQWDALNDWTEKRAVAAAEAKWKTDLDTRLKPFERQKATAEKIAKDAADRQSDVRSQIKEAEEAWGDALPKQGTADHAAILKYIRENPGTRLTTAVGKILVPKLRTGRAALRKEVLAELEAAPAGATRRVGQQGRATDAEDSAAPKSTEDIIKASIANLRR